MRSLAAALYLSATAASTAAQGPPAAPDVLPTRPLTWPALLPGETVRVSPRDDGAAVFEVRGRPGRRVRVEFALPPALVAPGGGRVPLVVGPADATAAPQPTPEAAVPFDPRVPRVFTLSATDGRLWLWLGGRVAAPTTAPAGASATQVFVRVTYAER